MADESKKTIGIVIQGETDKASFDRQAQDAAAIAAKIQDTFNRIKIRDPGLAFQKIFSVEGVKTAASIFGNTARKIQELQELLISSSAAWRQFDQSMKNAISTARASGGLPTRGVSYTFPQAPQHLALPPPTGPTIYQGGPAPRLALPYYGDANYNARASAANYRALQSYRLAGGFPLYPQGQAPGGGGGGGGPGFLANFFGNLNPRAAISNFAQRLQQNSQPISESARNLGTEFGRVFRRTVEIYLVYQMINIFKNLAKESIQFLSSIEQLKIGFAETLSIANRLYDANGKAASAALNIAVAFNQASGAIDDILENAIKFGVPAQKIQEAMMITAGAARTAGINIKETVHITSLLVLLAERAQVPFNVLARDVRDIFTGLNVQRTILGNILGLNQTLIRDYIAAGTLGVELSERLALVEETALKNVYTFEGSIVSIRAILQDLERTAGAGIFGAVETVLQRIRTELLDIRNNPIRLQELVDSAGQFADKLIKAADSWERIYSFIKRAAVALGAFLVFRKIGPLVGGLIGGAGETLTGTGIAARQLGVPGGGGLGVAGSLLSGVGGLVGGYAGPAIAASLGFVGPGTAIAAALATAYASTLVIDKIIDLSEDFFGNAKAKAKVAELGNTFFNQYQESGGVIGETGAPSPEAKSVLSGLSTKQLEFYLKRETGVEDPLARLQEIGFTQASIAKRGFVEQLASKIESFGQNPPETYTKILAAFQREVPVGDQEGGYGATHLIPVGEFAKELNRRRQASEAYNTLDEVNARFADLKAALSRTNPDFQKVYKGGNQAIIQYGGQPTLLEHAEFNFLKLLEKAQSYGPRTLPGLQTQQLKDIGTQFDELRANVQDFRSRNALLDQKIKQSDEQVAQDRLAAAEKELQVAKQADLAFPVSAEDVQHFLQQQQNVLGAKYAKQKEGVLGSFESDINAKRYDPDAVTRAAEARDRRLASLNAEFAQEMKLARIEAEKAKYASDLKLKYDEQNRALIRQTEVQQALLRNVVRQKEDTLLLAEATIGGPSNRLQEDVATAAYGAQKNLLQVESTVIGRQLEIHVAEHAEAQARFNKKIIEAASGDEEAKIAAKEARQQIEKTADLIAEDQAKQIDKQGELNSLTERWHAKLQQIHGTMLNIGTTFTDAVSSSLSEGLISGSATAISETYGQSLQSTFKTVFNNILKDKLGFDAAIETNFLRDIPKIFGQSGEASSNNFLSGVSELAPQAFSSATGISIPTGGSVPSGGGLAGIGKSISTSYGVVGQGSRLLAGTSIGTKISNLLPEGIASALGLAPTTANLAAQGITIGASGIPVGGLFGGSLGITAGGGTTVGVNAASQTAANTGLFAGASAAGGAAAGALSIALGSVAAGQAISQLKKNPGFTVSQGLRYGGRAAFPLGKSLGAFFNNAVGTENPAFRAAGGIGGGTPDERASRTIATAIFSFLFGPSGSLFGITAGGAFKLFQRKTTESLVGADLNKVLNALGLPTTLPNLRLGGPNAVNANLREFGAVYGPPEPIAQNLLPLLGKALNAGALYKYRFPAGGTNIGRGGYYPQFVSNALLNAATNIGLSPEDTSNLIDQFIASTLPNTGTERNLSTVLQGIRKEYTPSRGGPIRGAGYRTDVDALARLHDAAAEAIRIMEGLPKQVDAARLALIAFGNDGSLNIAKVERAIADVKTTFGGFTDYFTSLAKGTSFIDAGKQLGDAMTTGLIQRLIERLITEGAISKVISSVGIEINQAAEEFFAGNIAAGRKDLLSAISDVSQVQAKFLAFLSPIFPLLRGFGASFGIGQGTGFVNQTGIGTSLATADTPSFSSVPGPNGRPAPYILHGKETIRSSEQEDKIASGISELLSQGTGGKTPTNLTLIFQVDSKEMARANVDLTNPSRSGIVKSQARLGVR